MNLNKTDYEIILRYYGISIPRGKKGTLRKMKKRAHKVLVNKLCRCIKRFRNQRKKNMLSAPLLLYVIKAFLEIVALNTFGLPVKKKDVYLVKKAPGRYWQKQKKIYFRPRRN